MTNERQIQGQWDGIDTDSDRLVAALSAIEIAGTASQTGIDIIHATDEFVRYVSCFDREQEDIERKVTHSLRVAMLCHDFATVRHPEPASPDVGAMTLTGLLHDVGRFPQYAMHGSYKDQASGCDHGELAYEMLSQFGMLARFIRTDYPTCDETAPLLAREPFPSILLAIRYHNKWKLPDGLEGTRREYATMLRDADIVDILDIAASAMGMPHDPKTISEKATDEVMSAIRSRSTVDRSKMRNDTDMVLSRIALVFAIEGTIAREIACWHGSWKSYINGRDISGPASADIEEATEIIGRYLSGKTR